MKHLYILIIFFYFLIFFPFSEENILNNPIDVGVNSNPINYRIVIEDNYINGTNYTLKYHNSYLFTQSLFLCVDESNNTFLFAENKLYNLTGWGKHYTFEFVKEISSDVEYIDYI